MTNPTDFAPLLLALGRFGIELAAQRGRLMQRPAHPLPNQKEALARHRGAILAMLASEYIPASEQARYIYGERLGIADDLRMPTHPGSPAWLVAVGESMGSSCGIATRGLYCGHGETDGRDSGGSEGERSDTLRDCQGCERGAKSTVAAAER